MKKMSLKIITPNKIIYNGDIRMLTVRTVSGDQGILPFHAPLVTLLGIGFLKIYLLDNKMINYSISTGIMVVYKNIIKILTDDIEKN